LPLSLRKDLESLKDGYGEALSSKTECPIPWYIVVSLAWGLTQVNDYLLT